MSSATNKTIRFTQLSLLVALMLVLAFTPLGFVRIPPVSITIMHIPVIIAAILLGPGEGAFMGLVFGIISMSKAIAAPVPPIGLLFSPVASGAPLQSVILCIVPRVLLGVIAAYAFRALRRTGRPTLSIGVAAGIASVSHTSMVLGCMALLFSDIPLKEFFLTIVSINGLLELAAAVVVSAAVCRPLMKFLAGRK